MNITYRSSTIATALFLLWSAHTYLFSVNTIEVVDILYYCIFGHTFYNQIMLTGKSLFLILQKV